jgi:hypothetical protein
MYNAYILS